MDGAESRLYRGLPPFRPFPQLITVQYIFGSLSHAFPDNCVRTQVEMEREIARRMSEDCRRGIDVLMYIHRRIYTRYTHSKHVNPKAPSTYLPLVTTCRYLGK